MALTFHRGKLGGGTFAGAGLKRCWLYAGESSASQAKIDIIALSSHSLVGAPNLDASGYAGNGSTTGIDTNYNPSSDSLSGTTAMFSDYITGNDTGDNPVFGQTAGGAYTYLKITNSGADFEFGLADNSFNTSAGDGGGTMVGLWTVFATGSANVSVAKNGSVLESDTRGVNYFESVSLMVCGYNLSGALTDANTSRHGIFLIGSDSTKRAAIETALNAYMTAWSINAY